MPAGDNAYWSDVANAVYPPAVRLVQQAADTLLHATNKTLTWGAGSEEIDTHSFHDTAVNNTRVTPTVAGIYRVTFHLHLGGGSGNVSQLVAAIAKNGTRVDPQAVARPDLTVNAGTVATRALVQCNGTGDYIEAIGQQQNSASASRDTSLTSGFRSVLEVEYFRPLP